VKNFFQVFSESGGKNINTRLQSKEFETSTLTALKQIAINLPRLQQLRLQRVQKMENGHSRGIN